MTHLFTTRCTLARVFAFGVCASIIVPLVQTTVAVAQEAAAEEAAAEQAAAEEAPDESAQESKPRRVESPVADPLSIPTKDDWRDERRRLDEKTLFGPQARSSREQQVRQELARQFEELKRQHEALIQERSRLEQEFRRAMAQFEQLKQHAQGEIEAKKTEMRRAMAEPEMLHAQMAEMAARQQQHVQLPPGAMTKVFSLRNSSAAESARVLSEILGGQPLRIAVDERTNSLIVMADEATSKMVEALLLRLDVPRPLSQKDLTGETLQLRIVWLLDGIDEKAKERSANFVGVDVIKALDELGFEAPEVVCQQVATFTLGPENRHGQFEFQVPVLIESQRWQLEGQGQIQPMADDRFNVRFDLEFSHVDPSSGRTRSGHSGQLGGSIQTPLGHYTVMGTTTFVATSDLKSDPATGGALTQQHLSAFVVYLDRAREFPAAGAPSQQPDDKRR